MPGRKPSPEDLRAFRGMLVLLQREIRGDIGQLEADAFGESKAADITSDRTDSFDVEMSLELLERDGATAARIEAALERVEEGTFGACEACGGWILKSRLRVMPYVENCIDCQRRLELEAS